MTKHRIGEIDVTKESSFLGSTTGSTYYLAIQDLPGAENFQRELHADETVRQSVFDHGDAPKIGLKNGNFSLVCNLPGAVTAITATATADNFHSLLDSAFGSAQLASGSVTTGASATDIVDVTVGDGASFETGDFVLIDGEARVVESVTDDALTITPDLSSAPASGTTVNGSMSYALDDSSARDTYEIVWNGDSNQLAVKAQGCSLIPSFSSLGPGEGPARVTFEAQSGDHSFQTSTVANAADTAITQGPVQQEGDFILTDGTTILNLNANSFEINPPIGEVRVKDGSNANSASQPKTVMTEGDITAVVLQEDDSDDPIDQLRTWLTNGTELEVLYQIGNTAGDCIAFYCPYVFLNQEPIPQEIEGLTGVQIVLRISEDRSATNLTKSLYMGRM